jgi:hypothetical protein
MSFRSGISSMFRVHHGPKRWVNLPYALAVACCIPLALADDVVPVQYLVLLPLFVIQLAWPTVAGWAATIGAWFVLMFVPMLVMRFFYDITEITNWALVLIGLAPLIPLYIFRPRLRDIRAPGQPEEPSLT